MLTEEQKVAAVQGVVDALPKKTNRKGRHIHGAKKNAAASKCSILEGNAVDIDVIDEPSRSESDGEPTEDDVGGAAIKPVEAFVSKVKIRTRKDHKDSNAPKPLLGDPFWGNYKSPTVEEVSDEDLSNRKIRRAGNLEE